MNLCACVVGEKDKIYPESVSGDVYQSGVCGEHAAYLIGKGFSDDAAMVVLGVTQGMQPILGFNYGAGNWSRVKRTLKLGMLRKMEYDGLPMD